jgi:AsmA protein
VKLFRNKRRWAVLLLVVLVVLFALRPGANGLRKRIVTSISMALGRKVEVQWVKIRLLPQPGFDLENFVVYDDPSFSAEPMLRSYEVTATLRLRSLLRGRAEIGRLSLKEPSLNLVRNEQGRWNLASLIERAAQTPAAPTGRTRPESRPVFPYIEADTGRINVRIGAEKKPYALTDADFSLWLESENQWGMRLRAVPVRTDFNLTDTGMLDVSGTWLRSRNLAETPLKVSLQWTRAQLGQATKLFYGVDKGWRGEITVSTVLAGTPANLQVNMQTALQDFRRYDIVPTTSLRLAMTCNATYSSAEHTISQVLCVAPVGRGMLTAQGRIVAPTGPRSYDLHFSANDVPIQSIAVLARRAKKDLPQDLTAAGTLDGDFSLQTSAGGSLLCSGKGETTGFRLRSDNTSTELALDSVPFELLPASTSETLKQKSSSAMHAPSESIGSIGPFNVTLGKGHLMSVHGTVHRAGYSLSMSGAAEIKRLLQAAQTLGVHAPPPIADGNAKLNLQLAGSWSGFAAPNVTGTAQLSSVRIETRGLNGPLQLDSANLLLSDTKVQVSKLRAEGGGAKWVGALSFPRRCTSISACPINFDLQADSIAFDRLRSWVIPQPQKRPWYRFLAPSTPAGPPILLSLNAAGKLSAGHVLVRGITASKVSASVELQDGKLKLSGLDGDVFGGKHDGTWEADLAATPPTYSGSGTFEDISLEQVAEAMHDGWISGTGGATYEFASHGSTSQALLTNAALRLDFDARSGEFPHIHLAEGDAPLRAKRFTGRLTLHDGSFHIEQGKLQAAAGLYLVSGTASFGQKLDLLFVRTGAHGFNITGTLSAPRVLPASDTRAALKP